MIDEELMEIVFVGGDCVVLKGTLEDKTHTKTGLIQVKTDEFVWSFPIRNILYIKYRPLESTVREE